MNNYMVRQLRNIALSFRSRLISLSPYLLFFILQFSFFNSSEAQRPKKPSKPAPTVLSVGDLLHNYGLDTTLVNDTAVAVRYLDEQPQNYVDLTNLCVSFRTKAQSAIKSLNDDYTHSDNLIWIDSNIVVSDFGIYEYRLRLFSDFMGRRSIHYSRLEQQRIEAEKEAARLRAEEEARQQQLSRDKEAEGLRLNIERHHRSILSACDGAGISDKAKLKELKDLYYSYLMVYNKYDLSPVQATPASLAQLDELNSFQNDLLENILGENSLPYRIENFKNQLKVRCEKEHSDVYRSYSRVFKQTSVPISFASVSEYQDYIVRLQTVIAVQQRYVQTVELRNTIASNYDAISNLYAKKYKPVFNAYKDVHRTIDQVPAFTTNAQSLNFIQSLSDYIEAQQLYLQYFSHLEDITRRGVNVNERSELHRLKTSFYDKLKRAFERHAVEAQIVREILDSSPGNVVLCGDFNEAPSSYCYRTVRGDDMHDTFQDCGFGLTYTFHDRRMYFKIDHILYRGEMEAVDWRRDKAGDSDHYPQVATFVWK